VTGSGHGLAARDRATHDRFAALFGVHPSRCAPRGLPRAYGVQAVHIPTGRVGGDGPGDMGPVRRKSCIPGPDESNKV
jgi:hypothetical protein